MLGLGARDVVHGVPGERERSSARHAVREVVVPVCEDRSAAIACSVQAGNHFGVASSSSVSALTTMPLSIHSCR